MTPWAAPGRISVRDALRVLVAIDAMLSSGPYQGRHHFHPQGVVTSAKQCTGHFEGVLMVHVLSPTNALAVDQHCSHCVDTVADQREGTSPQLQKKDENEKKRKEKKRLVAHSTR